MFITLNKLFDQLKPLLIYCFFWSIFCLDVILKIKLTIGRSDMKHILISSLLIILSLTLVNCSDDPINNITFQNKAAGAVIVSFRGETIDVASGQIVELKDIDKGEFEYDTVYELPSAATSSSAEGEMSGSFVLKAGTKILVIYSSVLSEEGAYTIYASVTTSDDLTEGEDPNPVGP
jgi:hypothetical protein